MRFKAKLLAGALAVAAVAVAAMPDCEILLPKTTQAGDVVLAPGQYRIWVNGSKAVFLDMATRHSFIAAVRVATTKPHEATSIAMDKRGDTRILRSIDLAGTNETLEFDASVSDTHLVEP